MIAAVLASGFVFIILINSLTCSFKRIILDWVRSSGDIAGRGCD